MPDPYMIDCSGFCRTVYELTPPDSYVFAGLMQHWMWSEGWTRTARGACGQPMYSLSRLYRFGVQKIQENLEESIRQQKKHTPVRADTRPGHEGDNTRNFAAFLTDWRAT